MGSAGWHGSPAGGQKRRHRSDGRHVMHHNDTGIFGQAGPPDASELPILDVGAARRAALSVSLTVPDSIKANRWFALPAARRHLRLQWRERLEGGVQAKRGRPGAGGWVPAGIAHAGRQMACGSAHARCSRARSISMTGAPLLRAFQLAMNTHLQALPQKMPSA